MNKHLSKQELADVATKYPVNNLMSRDEKLDRLAAIVRDCKHDIVLFDRVEDMSQTKKERTHLACSVFDIAMQDPVFRAAGLQGSTVAHGQRFFELSNEELHHLSCNCGGSISRGEMSRRLTEMKGRGTPAAAVRQDAAPAAIFLLGLAMWGIGTGLAYHLV